MNHLRVACCILVRDEKVLLTKRPDHYHNGGRWELPGGKVEDGETPEECIVRELQEELGIRARVITFVGSSRHNYIDRTVELLGYRCEIQSGSIADIGVQEHTWAALDRLNEYDITEADLPILETIRRLLHG